MSSAHVSIYSSVANLPAVPARDRYTGEPSAVTWEGFIDVATATSHHDYIRLVVEVPAFVAALLINDVEAEALIAALAGAVRLVRESQALTKAEHGAA